MIKHVYVRRISGLIAFFILIAVTLGYFVMHKPFSPELALAMIRASWQVVIALAILSVAGGLGRRILTLPEASPLVRLTLQAGLGLGLISLGVLAIGALGGLRPILGAGALLVLAGLLLRHLVGWWRDWLGLSSLWKESGRLGKAIACGTSLILLFTLLSALAPPVKFDALVYHLVLPHIYLSQGHIVYTPQIMFWGMPQGGEMLYTWAMMLAGDSAAVVLGWLFGVLALVGLAGFVAERLGAAEAWGSVAALMSAFTLGSALSWGYVDWLVILYGLAFFIALDRWSRQGQRADLLLAGVFVGLAMGVKYTAGVLALGGIAAIVWSGKGKSNAVAIANQLIQFGLTAGLIFLPWLIKNVLATGNPVYPFLFPSGAMSALRLVLYQGGAPWGGWQDVFFLPFRATFLGVEGGLGYSASIGALILGLGLAAWLSWPALSEQQRKVLVLAGLVIFPAILFWMVAARFSYYLLQSRLYFAIFPALAVQAGVGFSGLRQLNLPPVRLGRIVGFLVAFVLLLNVIEVGIYTFHQAAPQAVLGLKTPDAYLSDNLGWYIPAMQGQRELPTGSKVLMLWEPRSLYCWPKCEPDEVIDRWLRERYMYGADNPRTTAEILQAWQQAGYTHLLYYRLGADFIQHQDNRYQPADWQALDDLLSQLHTVTDFGATYTLYSLEP